jgi:type IV pilus assembly protein PilQ
MRKFILAGHVRTLLAAWLSLIALLSVNVDAADTTGQVGDVQLSNSVEKLDYATVPGGKVVVRITMKELPNQPPASFMTKIPPRLVLDFPSTSSHLPKNSIAVNSELLRSMNVAQASNRTRLVLNLNKQVNYSTSTEGNNIVLTLEEASTAPIKETIATHFTQPKVVDRGGVLSGVDFQRGKNGEARVIVDLSAPGSGIDIRQQGKNLVVDFINTALAEKLERRLNVTDFATPVLAIDTFKQGNNTRMVIEPKGEWEHSAYQTENKFVVEVKPIIFDPSKAVQGSRAGFGGEKLSLDFNSIEVRNLLRIIGDFTGKNVVVSDSVTGTLSLHLKDVPWDQALDIILKQTRLGMDNMGGNTIMFAPKAEISARRKEEQDQENQIDETKPLVTQSFSVKYQKAEEIKALVSDAKQPLLSKRGSAVVDVRTNTLFVKDIDTSLVKIQEILNKIDIPQRQVLIESRIVNADESFSKSLGSRFGVVKNDFMKGASPNNGTNVVVGSTLASSYGTAQTGTSVTPTDLNVNLPAKSATGAAVSALALSLFKLPAGFLLNLELSAAEADGKTKIISSPRVITANQNKATFDFGEEIPYNIATNSGATSISFKKATLGLEVTPLITPDEKIDLDITVTNDSRGAETGAGPAINTNKVTTKVLIDNGETAVLGGFYKETKSSKNERVPFFGTLPIFGPLFRQNENVNTKQEILFFITPKIVSESLQIK